ncbi:MAG: hypothetical protein IT291_11175, partial [Deltaproteobacteria bacterium]|nr:hypothetical protein [Deltaproteobacteria bacterium]
NNPPTIDNWQTIDDPSLDPGRQFFQVTAIKTYSFLPTTLLASFLQDEGGIDGEFSMYDTANSFAKTTPADLQGLPIRSFEVINTSTIFVGAGVPASNATASTNGIYRSTDSGVSWSEIIDTDLSSTVNTNEFAYDSAQDILYAAAEDGLFRLLDATTATNWERCNSFTSSGPGSGNEEVFTVAVDLSTGALYAASGRDVYRSNDNCDSWSRIYEGLDSEITSTLFFDALVQGSNTGFYALEENDDVLTSPSYVLWNGFLQMVNILELVNKGTSDLSVTISLFDINGVEQSETTLDISAQNQRDVIVNDLTGFSADSYGLLRLTFSSANLDGRMFFYRTLDSYQSYEFAYALPLSNARDGTSYVAFNTFNPSLNAADSGDQVLNWLSIVNLSSETESFEINRYGLDGTLLATQNIGVQAFGRTDIDGGHGEGDNVVGYNEIVPADPSAQYKAELVRYGQRTDSTFAFAFPLVSTSAEDEHWVEISAGGGAQNWLEVQNIGADAQNVNLYFYDNNGNLVSLSNAALGARSGVHLDASAVLGAGQSGAVHIQGTDDNDVLVAQSMFYFRDSSGSIEAMYGSQPPSSLGGTRWGSWNLFLNAYNWLRLFNTGDSTADVVVTVYNGNNTPTERAFALAPKSGTDLGLHETSSFATSVDTYGSVKVEGSNLLTGLLRLRPTQSGGIDFAAPTAVRP